MRKEEYIIPPCFYRIGIKALILNNEGKILLIQNENKKWELPGGGIERDESVEENLKRELMEELGVTVEYINPNPLYFVRGIHSIKGFPLANIIYSVQISGAIQLGISDETSDFGYFSREEARKLDVYENVSKFLEVYTN